MQLGHGGYADRVYIGLLTLREATTDSYTETVDRVATMPRLRAAFGLDEEMIGPPKDGLRSGEPPAGDVLADYSGDHDDVIFAQRCLCD